MKRILAVLAAAIMAPAVAPAQITVDLHPGDLTYQFADPVTGQPIQYLFLGGPGQTGQVALYLAQVGGSPPNLFQRLGIEALGVRLVYDGYAARVAGGTATTLNSNITANPNFDLTFKGGSTSNPPDGAAANNTTDTSTNAALTEGIVSLPAPTFPGPEDPTNNLSRILIGKFKFTAVGLTQGIHPVYAIDPFSIGNQLLTGPNPPTDPADGFHGEIPLDQYLSQYANSPVIPTLIITEPEPGTLALCGLAAGFLAWRGRQKVSPLPALRERGRG